MAKDLLCHTYYRHKHGAQQLQFPEDATHFRGVALANLGDGVVSPSKWLCPTNWYPKNPLVYHHFSHVIFAWGIPSPN
jgi:hypothetical protein